MSKIEEARAAGYSDDEILDHMSKSQPKIAVALKEGYSASEILKHLGGDAPPPTEPPERSWGNTAVNFVAALPGGVYRTAKSLGHAVMNPSETASGINDALRGAAMNIPGAKLNLTPEDSIRAKETAGAISQKYKDNYGSTAGFKNMLATRPEDILLDVSTVASGGAGLAGKAGTVGNTLSKVAAVTNPLAPVELGVNAMAKLGAKGAGLTADAVGGRLPAIAAGKVARDAAGPDIAIIRAANEANPTATAVQAGGAVAGDAYNALANRAAQPDIGVVAAKLAKDEADLMKYGDRLKPAEKIDLEQSIRQSKATLASVAESQTQAAAGSRAANSMLNQSEVIPKIPGIIEKASRFITGPKVYFANGTIDVLNGVLKAPTIKALEDGMKTGKSANELMATLPAIEQNKVLQFLASNPKYLTQMGVSPAADVANTMVRSRENQR